MPLIGLRGERGIVYMAMVNTRDSTQGMVKIRETKATATRHGKQLARHSWDVVNPGLDKPEKEAVVPKVAETSKEAGRSTQACRAAATDRYGKSGFFILLRWLIGFFLPQPNCRVFLPINYKFFPL